ncbi:MAG: septum formation initiator family protein [Candidatus Margulisiibacteriota bacterium]
MKWKKRKPELFFVLLLVLISYFVFVLLRDTRTLSGLERENLLIEKNLDKEKALSKQLRQKAQELSSSACIELAARKKLGLVKKGETPYRVIGLK